MGLVRQYLPNGNQYFRMGLSAGAADALNDEMRNPGASGIALYSGVISLTGAWNQAGQPAPGGGIYGSFLPNIQYGWGDWYLSLQGSNTNQTPESSPSYWTKVSSTLIGLPLSYYNAWGFTQKGAWNPATAYNQNDIVVRPYTGGISGLAAGDPGLNYSSFAKVPIQAWAEENDSTIMSAAWQTAFINGVTAAGNKHAVSNILSDCPPTGGCHLTPAVLNPTNNQPWNITTNQSPTLAWFNSLRGSWTVPSSGSYVSAAYTLASGSTTIDIPAGSLPVGTDTLTASYTSDSTSSPTYNSATGSNSVTVTLPKATPTITWATPAAVTYGTALSATQLDATASVAGSFSYSPPLGAVLTAGSQTLTANFTPTDTTDYNTASASVTLTVNKATPTITWTTPAGVTVGTALGATQLDATASVPGTFVYSPTAGAVMSTAGNTTLSATFTPTDTTDYTNASATVVLTVNPAASPSFTVSGTAVSVTPGASTGNTSTITLTPSGGFTGNVAMTATVTSNPAGAQYLPTLSFGSSSPVTIVGTNVGTAYLTVFTTAATSGAMVPPRRPGAPWYAAGGATLACLLLFGIPARRRSWRTMLGMLALLAALSSGVFACGGGGGGGSGGGGGGGGGGIAGTTAGSYTIIVTGTSGSITATCPVALTVQ
jgi:hypothetical protein